MNFSTASLQGVYLINLNPTHDDRGFFSRQFCKKKFEDANLEGDFVQTNLSYNKKKGTLRGLHYQLSPHAETKLIYCQRGKIFDVLFDLRPSSSTYKKSFQIVLAPDNFQALYVPDGIAHGFQTLVDDSEVFYLINEYYDASSAKGIRYDDKTANIRWPLPISMISERDLSFPEFSA